MGRFFLASAWTIMHTKDRLQDASLSRPYKQALLFKMAESIHIEALLARIKYFMVAESIYIQVYLARIKYVIVAESMYIVAHLANVKYYGK